MATYTTASLVKSFTNITALSTADDTAIEKLIVRAEYLVDSFLPNYERHEDSANPERTFPRDLDEDDDGVPYIPKDIEIATNYIVEYLFLSGEPQSKDDLNGGFKSETFSEAQKSYVKVGSSSGINELYPAAALQILNKFKIKNLRISAYTIE